MFFNTKVSLVPMARSEGLLIQPVGDEWVVYDEQNRQAHCLKPLAARVFKLADGTTNADELAKLVSRDLGETVDAASVLDAVAQLEEHGLMDDSMRRGAISRREMMRKSAKVGAAAAVAAPLISSVAAAPAWAGASHTCGPLLCCPCLTASDSNANDCCFIRGVTANCQCVAAQSNTSKYCKPSGAASLDAFCLSDAGFPSCADCNLTNNPTGCNQIPCTGTHVTRGVDCFCS
jgi:hypothetical protein